jgi:hypothetical protein
MAIHELLGPKGTIEPVLISLRDEFAAGLAAYRSRAWATAETRFLAHLALKPDDRPARVYAARVQYFAQNPRPGDWDGVWTFAET